MTFRPSKRPGHLSKRNSRKRGLSFCSLSFRLVALLSVAYSIYEFAPSQKNAAPNISQSTESGASGAVNDNQIRSNESDQALIVNDKVFLKTKGERQINNTTKFNGSFVYESVVNYRENKGAENDQEENLHVDAILYIGCGLTVFAILTLNVLYFLLQVFKTTNYSNVLFKNTLYCSRSSKTLLMAFGLLLSYAPVGSDVTLSTQGTYFQNEAPGRYLKGYVIESSVVPSLFHCQMRCDTLHLTCKSLNYVQNEDGSNICRINYETQYCALPGDFIVKENSFYVETMPEKDEAVLCSTCGYKGVIKKTKETPGFMCLCQGGFYGDRCQHKDDLNSSLILNGTADYIRQLRSWLPSSSTWRLCWRATQHGRAGTTFHSQCDNKGSTVTIVRVGEYVFGGCADVSWKSPSPGVWVSSENSFLFSLKNNDDLKPFKAPVVYQNRDHALKHRSDYGPIFGRGRDLIITSNANSKKGSRTRFGATYQLPEGYTYNVSNTNALLAGSLYFTPSEVEVFYLQSQV